MTEQSIMQPLIARFTATGAVVPVWGKDELRLPKSLENVVVFAFKDKAAAEQGDPDRAATAFWVSVPTSGGEIPFLITNRHVVDDGTLTFRYEDGDGLYILETDEREWTFHKDSNIDVAVFRPVARQIRLGTLVRTTGFVLKEHIDSLDLRLGDDVAMLGRHLNYDGIVTNCPTARFGHIAQMPNVPLRNERGMASEAYLVQMPSLPGFSGSPVFLVQDQLEKNSEQNKMVFSETSKPRLVFTLGINCGHIPAYTPTYQANTAVRNEYLNAEINSGISVILPAWRIMEAIEQNLERFGVGHVYRSG